MFECKSYILAVSSIEPEANLLPSGENATEDI